MAKKRKPRIRGVPTATFYKNRVRDDFFPIASGLSRRFEPLAAADTPTINALLDENYIPSVRSYLSEVEDRRSYHPAGAARPTVSPRRHHTPKPSTVSFAFSKPRMVFGAPRHVMICVRRKIRDEVLHALGKTGRGSGRPKRYNQYSKVRC